jgi:4-amino-4-deoxy-L-arabinose transferase-like glycosyltransferase
MVLRVRVVIPPVLTGKTYNRMSLNHVGFGIIRSQMKLPDPSNGPAPVRHDQQPQPEVKSRTRSRKLLLVLLIFFTAFGVRLLNWQSSRSEVYGVQSSVTLNYKQLAGLIHRNGLASRVDPSSSTSNPDLLGHPPGYPILLSFVYRVATERDMGVQLVQLILDSISAVIIFLIACELFPVAVGMIAGLMAAFAPQFSWNSILLLPDSLAALPILLAVLLITRTAVGQAFLPVDFETKDNFEKNHSLRKKDRQECLSYSSRLLLLLIAGALVGVSCWLRANALLLPTFLVLSLPFIYKRGERLRPALMLIAGACLVIAPLTIRNALVFGKFIPVSLGAGQTLVEGIADYNTDGTLGLPQTDVDMTRGEAETYRRPDYANSLFTPDGPERDRARLARGLSVVGAHPFWFTGVMIRRAASMLRLERTPLLLATTKTGTLQSLFQRPLRIMQKLFITAIFLPLVLIGAGILIYQRQVQSLAILLVVPGYYFSTQSALHTEYRYVLTIHYFLFVLAAVGVFSIIGQMSRRFTRLNPAPSPSHPVRAAEL